MVLERALATLHDRSADILALTERLVRINSHSANIEGVNRVGDALTSALAGLPLELERVPGRHTGDHLVFRTRKAHERASVLLIGHHDTVFPAGVFDTFSCEGDIAKGPGILDMKGGLALVCAALSALARAGVLEQLPITFVSVGDEEIGSPSSRARLRELANEARLALVFEAGRTGDAIVTSRRGSGHAILRAHGRAAHAGNALADGRNAIWALARAVDRAQALTEPARGISFSAGLVHGGTARNTVAEEAMCEADLRFTDPEGQRELHDALVAITREVGQSLDGTRLELEFVVTREPWTRSDASGALCERYGACQRASGLLAGEAPRAGGGSDANTVGAVGLPAIDGLGPRGTGFHTTNEQIEVSSLVKKAEALVRFLLSDAPV